MSKTAKQANYTLPIIMMIALFFMISFVTGLQNPFGVIVKNQFSATNLMSQLGNAANFIAYAFMGWPAGLLLTKIGYKRTALLAIIVGFIGVGISFLSGIAESFGVYLTGAFISGFSMCLLNSVVNPMLNTLGGGGKKGNQLIQLGGSVNSIGATIVPVLVGYLMGNVANATIDKANPALFLAMGIFALTFVVLFFVNIPEPHMEKADAPKEKSKHSALSFRHFLLGALGIFVYVGVEVGIPNFINLYMVNELSFDTAVVGSIVGIYWLLMMVGRLTGAAIGGSVSSKTMLIVTSAAAMVFIGTGIALGNSTSTTLIPAFNGGTLSFEMVEAPISILFFVLCGLCTSVMWGGIFNLAVEGLGKYTAMASGIFMIMVCGGGILPLIQGAVADATSYIASYWVIFAGAAYLLFYALVGSKNVNKDIPTK